MNEPMTFLDFFSGVGGFRKGFELCGMICKGHCEIDKFADRSYRAIHDVKEDEWYGEDITKTESADLPRVNLWAGGFPCQDISVSGRQRGLAADQLYKSLAVACGDRKYFSSTLGSKMSISDKVDAFPVLRNAVEA